MYKKDFKALSRADKAKLITNGVLKHILVRNQGRRIGLPEININVGKRTSKLRIDVLELHREKDYLIGYEVKSCISDFNNDEKWANYLSFVDGLYFVFDEDTFEKHREDILARLQGCAGVYTYSCEWDSLTFRQSHKFCQPKRHDNVYKLMLFNYLLRTQIKIINSGRKLTGEEGWQNLQKKKDNDCPTSL